MGWAVLGQLAMYGGVLGRIVTDCKPTRCVVVARISHYMGHCSGELFSGQSSTVHVHAGFVLYYEHHDEIYCIASHDAEPAALGAPAFALLDEIAPFQRLLTSRFSMTYVPGSCARLDILCLCLLPLPPLPSAVLWRHHRRFLSTIYSR